MTVAKTASLPVVTGLGVIAPNGIGVADYWAATLEGKSGIEQITRFDATSYPSQLAGEVKPDLTNFIPNRLVPQTDHMTRMALIAAEEALADADADPKELPEFAAGVVTAASGGGVQFGQMELENLWSKGRAYVSAYQSFAWFYPVNSGQISIRHGMRGASGALVADQAGALDAVAKAQRHIRQGTPLMLTGGVDGSLCPWSWICLMKSGRVSQGLDPSRSYVPFDRYSQGYIPGEGGALLVVEEPQFARERGAAHRYGHIVGHAATFDPRPGSGRPPTLRRAIEQALSRADLSPSAIDVVFADAHGVPDQDCSEAEALTAIFGPRGVPVTAPKTMTGRLFAGGGALDIAAALLSMRDSVIPPTVHVDHPFFPDLDLVTQVRETPVRTALVVARGQGGFNSATILRKSVMK